jgi:hypothetical protein
VSDLKDKAAGDTLIRRSVQRRLIKVIEQRGRQDAVGAQLGVIVCKGRAAK